MRPKSTRMKALFKTDGPVEIGRVYLCDIAAGDGARFIQPAVNHPGERFSTSAASAIVGRLVHARRSARQMARCPYLRTQIWLWKDIGTLIAVCRLRDPAAEHVRAYCCRCLSSGSIRECRRAPPSDKRGWHWWAALVAIIVIPAATYLHLHGLRAMIGSSPSRYSRKAITNQLAVWALLNGGHLLGARLRAVARQGRVGTHHIVLAGRHRGDWLTSASAILSPVVLADALFNVDLPLLGAQAEADPGVRRFVSFLTYLPFSSRFFLVAIRAISAGPRRT